LPACPLLPTGSSFDGEQAKRESTGKTQTDRMRMRYVPKLDFKMRAKPDGPRPTVRGPLASGYRARELRRAAKWIRQIHLVPLRETTGSGRSSPSGDPGDRDVAYGILN